MTTARDLLIVALDDGAERTAEQGDLSLTLAGAEMIDLLEAGAVRLDGDRLVPGGKAAPEDWLLAEAAASLVGDAPYESLTDWLWRRGRGLATAYRSALESEGQLVRETRRGLFGRAGDPVPADSPARRRAVERQAAGEPVLTALAEAAGVHGERTGDAPEVTDDDVATVMAAVNDAVVELASERQRRAIHEAAFDNIWRGPIG
ncbi:GPP34 family phosphoprotein [Streptomyces sp. NPDC048603]|uniref:GOLPH3/VPS74 family protein n=1 Tax=Streptomyces sp. NPDC048603 TaxID=3365577 RepID=UPI003719C5C2